MSDDLVRTRYRLILPTSFPYGSTQIAEIYWKKEPSLADIKSIVAPALGGKGHLSEHVSVWWRFEPEEKPRALDMFVDENGLMLRLPRNDIATAIYRNAALSGKSGMGPDWRPENVEDLSFVVGPAILFDRRVWY